MSDSDMDPVTAGLKKGQVNKAKAERDHYQLLHERATKQLSETRRRVADLEAALDAVKEDNSRLRRRLREAAECEPRSGGGPGPRSDDRSTRVRERDKGEDERRRRAPDRILPRDGLPPYIEPCEPRRRAPATTTTTTMRAKSGGGAGGDRRLQAPADSGGGSHPRRGPGLEVVYGGAGGSHERGHYRGYRPVR